ncbi:MAG: LuxR C-terminal-related transcriptional regulator, partial [bacterium]|nr:LuxR C-terminal-related transcriptional regulator [bacterium]
GKFIYPRDIIFDIIDSIAEKKTESWKSFNFTEQERRVCDFLIEGLTNKEIGQKLNITEKTVKAHMSHIYAKLSSVNRVEAVRKLLLNR